MRTIKFRVWEISEYGNEMRYVDLYWFEENMIREWPQDNNSPFVGNYVLMQFTGLLDRSGKEIYEGDIVAGRNVPDYVKSIVRIGESETEVDFGEYSISKRYYGVYLEGSIDLEERLLKGEMEVIGNIYEDPELIVQ
jgi:uncharacterized phage protein (TIGR01671 family)